MPWRLIFRLLSFFHQALLLEPVSVFGPSVYRNCLREYLSVLIRVHAAIALATTLILGMSAWLAGELTRSGTLPEALAGAMFAAPWILLFWLVRRAFYVKLGAHF